MSDLHRLEVTSSWVPDGKSDVEVVIGYVSGMGGRRGVVACEDKEVSFPLSMAPSVDGYRPHVNDWVKVCMSVRSYSSEGRLSVVDIICVSMFSMVRKIIPVVSSMPPPPLSD